MQGLPPPFLLNRPSMYLLTSSETRQPKKAPNFAVIWTSGDTEPEIVNTTNGKPENGFSKVCKVQLMKRFVQLVGKISSMTEIEKNLPNLYCDVKEAVTSYKVKRFWEKYCMLYVVFRLLKETCMKRLVKRV